MIVCHCNIIASGDIHRAVKELTAEAIASMITPGLVFKCCGARPQCGGCMPHVSTHITIALEERAAASEKGLALMTEPVLP
jgi:bacterioferritin-associated ferredoxin